MKVICVLFLVALLAAFACSCSGQAMDAWRDPSDLRLVEGHLIGDHKDMLEGDGVIPVESQNPRSSDMYDVETLRELHRLFGTSPGQEDFAFATKALLAMPLAGRYNGLQLFLRPPHDIYAGLLEKFGARRYREIPPIKTAPGYIAVDTHVHTAYSHDSLADVSQVLLAANRRGLAGVAITDHGTLMGAHAAERALKTLVAEGKLPNTFFIIHGEEITSKDGHIIALYIKKEIPIGMSAKDTITAIHEQGGIAIAAHPMLKHSLGRLAYELPFDAVETQNEAEILQAGSDEASQKARETFYAHITKPRIGSSDAHDPGGIGLCYTVLACEPTAEGVRSAILTGSTLAQSDIPEKSSPIGQDAQKKHSATRAVLASIVGLDGYLCKLTHANQADVAVWPDAGIRFHWGLAF